MKKQLRIINKGKGLLNIIEDDLEEVSNPTPIIEYVNQQIDTRVLKSTGKSLVFDTEITKLSHLDDTTDLQKPISTAQATALADKLSLGGYVGTAQDLEDAITAAVTGVTGQALVPSSPAFAGTGIASGIALEPGTYTNLGGVVVNSNSIAVIARDALGAYSITQTALVLTGYVQKTDIIDSINSNEIQKPSSANSVRVLKEEVKKKTDDNNILVDSDELIISDSAGYVIVKISKEGLHAAFVRAQEFAVDNVEAFMNFIGLNDLNQLISNTDRYTVSDEVGNVIAKFDENGLTVFEKKEVIDAGLPADINMIISYGQSLSVYGNEGVAYDDDIPNNILMFQNGIAVDLYNPVEGTFNGSPISEDAYFGTAFTPLTKTTKQRSLAGLMREFSKLIVLENNYNSYADIPYEFIGATCGLSGASVDELSVKTANPYLRILKSVENGKKLAANQNKSFAVPVLTYMQGEGNYASTTNYVTKLTALFEELNTDIKTITGQEKDVQFIVYQPATQVGTQTGDGQNIIALDFLEVVKNNENIHFGCAMYQFNYGSDDLHADATYSYDEIGALMGVQFKRVLETNPISPIVPLSSYYVAQTGGTYKIFVKYKVDFPPLKFSNYASVSPNPNASAITNYGFSLKSGATELITAVSIINKDTVMITCLANPTGLDLTYAWNGKLGGGNLTDSYENNYRPNRALPVQRFNLYNFAPINKITF